MRTSVLAKSFALFLAKIHAQYRKRFRASYNTEREREKDGSDVTIVALKLAMSFALLLAKNVHLSIGEEFCAFPCQNFAR